MSPQLRIGAGVALLILIVVANFLFTSDRPSAPEQTGVALAVASGGWVMPGMGAGAAVHASRVPEQANRSELRQQQREEQRREWEEGPEPGSSQ